MLGRPGRDLEDETMATRTNRREFLGAAAATLAATRMARAAEVAQPPKIGIIGCGAIAREHLQAIQKQGVAEVVALCDVDRAHLEAMAERVTKHQERKPALFKDYHDLLDVPGLQAVFIATPPHWHALPFIAACEKGIDIYCEKPLAYDVREGQAMVNAAAKHRRIVQIGFQRRQSDAVHAAKDYLRSGKAGRIIQADARIHYSAARKSREVTDPPATLDWDLWCGPAPKLDYCEAVGHYAWRLEKEIGNGHLVDWGIHLIDATRFILDETMPRSIVAVGGLYDMADHITTPDTLTAHFEFKTCPVVWRHRIWGSTEYRPEVNNGIFFFCEKETVFVTDRKWMIIPGKKGAEPKVMPAENYDDMIPRNIGEFLVAVGEGRNVTNVMPADGFQSTACVQLAMISYETGTKVVWDDERKAIVDNPTASKLLKREYRSPYQHPYKG